MKSNEFSADFIVIGSGLGGLFAAAYLAQANYKVIVLEKNSEIGGKCTTRYINGHRYVIGANTFGSRTDFLLKKLGINLEWIPAPLRLFGENGSLSFPLGFSSISELKNFDVPVCSLLKIFMRLVKSSLIPTYKTYRDLIDFIINEPKARELLYSEAWYIGAHPEWLPANSLKLFLSTYYGYHKPIYPLKGAQIIPDSLSNYITSNKGEIIINQDVQEIAIENNKATGVRIKKQWYSAKFGIISNTEISQTLSMLNRKKTLIDVNNINPESAYPFALLLLTLSNSKAPAIITKPSINMETNATVLSNPICDTLDELERGQISSNPICNLILSDNKAQFLNGEIRNDYPVHVSILWPKKSPKNINLNLLKKSILEEIDKRYPGFAESVLTSEWITPPDYQKRFGFSSNPAPIIETPTFTKQSWKSHINGLYNVGTTVLPSGSNTGCAIESGICCAEEILNCK